MELGVLGTLTQRQATTLKQAFSRAGTPSSAREPITPVHRLQHLRLLGHSSRTSSDPSGWCHQWTRNLSLTCNFKLSRGHVKGGQKEQVELMRMIYFMYHLAQYVLNIIISTRSQQELY